MKKNWSMPKMESVMIMNTEYAPQSGNKQDGWYQAERTDMDGNPVPGTSVKLPTYS